VQLIAKSGRKVMLRVSIHGMYDCHLFHPYTGRTVDEVLMNWLEHISKPIPAIMHGQRVDDIGPTSLGPAIVLYGDKELRRVGKMVFARVTDYGKETQRVEPDLQALIAYRRALLDDPDIPRVLSGNRRRRMPRIRKRGTAA
jgi:hypothetical protein